MVYVKDGSTLTSYFDSGIWGVGCFLIYFEEEWTRLKECTEGRL